jgi:S-adenosylmethionine synthetase
VTGVFHWTGNDNMTKYDMCMTMAKAFNLPTSHVIVDKNPSAGAKRPYDARLDSSRIQGLGISKHTPFSEGIQSCIIKSTFTGAVVLPKID